MSTDLKIQEFSVERLHNTGDTAFQGRILNATSLLTEESGKAMIATYKEKLDAFVAVVKLKQSFTSTEEILELDAAADSAWRAIHGQVKVMERHPSKEVQDIAHEVMLILDKYGDITSLSYNDEYGAMDSLILDLNALGADKLGKIYLTDWVSELSTRYTEFMTALSTREDEKAQLEVGETKAKRTAADNAYRDFITMINAKALVFGIANYEAFIKRANVIIDEAKFELAQRDAANKKKPTEDKSKDATDTETTTETDA